MLVHNVSDLRSGLKFKAAAASSSDFGQEMAIRCPVQWPRTHSASLPQQCHGMAWRGVALAHPVGFGANGVTVGKKLLDFLMHGAF